MLIRPLPISRAQKQFRESGAWMRGFVGGRGAGKTRIGSTDISQRALPGDPWMAISPDNNMIRETTLPTFLEVVEYTGQYVDHVLSPTPRVWFRSQWGKRGSRPAEIVFKGAEKPDKLRGPNKAGIWFDEASIISQSAFEIGIAVCRYRGRMGPVLATFTPRGFQHWTFKSFYSSVDESRIGTDGCSADGINWLQGRPFRSLQDTYLVHCPTRENPFIAKEYVGRVGQNYSSTLSLQELEGEFIEIAGLVFQRDWLSQTVISAPANATRVRYWDKAACLVAGTMVLTQRGEVPIEEVTTADKVLTREGWKHLSFAGPTKIATSLVTVIYNDGSHVTCTPEHRIWCNRANDWMEAKDLNGYSRCVTHSTTTEEALLWPGQETQSLKSAISTALDTQGTDRARVSVSNDTSTRTSGIKSSSDLPTAVSTEMFGSTFAEKSPLAIISTTLTEIGTTTTSQIFNPSLLASIEESTRLKCLVRQLSKKQKLDLSAVPKSNFSGKELVVCAGNRTNPLAQRPSIALQNVQHRSKTSGSELGTPNMGAVVYDLTVKNGPPEFFANGTLVHNSADAGCFTVGLLMAKDPRGIYYVEDVVRGQWSQHNRNQIMLQTAQQDARKYGGSVLTYIEQEGGGDGKSIADQLITMMSAFPVYRDVVGGGQWKTKGNTRLPGDAKVRRALPFAAQAEAGNVRLCEGNWNRDYIDELTMFPEFAFADQVDGSSGAYNVLQRIAPTYGEVASRSTEPMPQSLFGQTAHLGNGSSVAQWSELPWNQNIEPIDEQMGR